VTCPEVRSVLSMPCIAGQLQGAAERSGGGQYAVRYAGDEQ
jgi:hypothetical protein